MEEFKKNPYQLRLYEKKEHEDFLFTKLWMALKESGDIVDVLRPDRMTLFQFLETIQRPRFALYSLNSKNEIDYLFLFEPASDVPDEKTLIIGILWSSPQKRGSRLLVQKTIFILNEVFKKFEHCLTVTWQEGKTDLFTKFGFSVVGFFPSLYNIHAHDAPWG